ncbi:MAG: hypothetical protein ACRDD2_02970 [Sarcina sp.]
MKKKYILITSIVITLVLILTIFFGNEIETSYIVSEYNYEILSKGLKGANSFQIDKNGEIYLSYANQLLKLKSDNTKEKIVISHKGNLGDIEIYKNNLFYILGESLILKNLNSKEETIIIDKIPNYGDVTLNKLLIKDDYLYLTIDSATNSAVLSKEDLDKNPNNKGDLSPIELELNGINFEKGKTGAFSEYGKKNSKGEKIKESELGHSSIVKLDLKNFSQTLVATGIRNVAGIDYDSLGNIYITVGGIEEKGNRALYGDSDYIYSLENEGLWYGWPDYSGGDPIDSSRFRKEGKPKQQFILKKHPNLPPAPFYQNDSINSLGELVIDKSGSLISKDSMIIYDKVNNSFLSLNKFGEKKEITKFKNGYISDLKFYENELYFLDNENGYLVKLKNDFISNNNKMKFLILVGVSFIFLILAYFFKILRKK